MTARRSRPTSCACDIAGTRIGAASGWITAPNPSSSRKARPRLYQDAKYALLRVAEDGGTILTDLADQNRAAIKAP